MRTICSALAVALGLSGCTHRQLQQNVVGTSQILMQIHQQQVLDNLAKFVCDYNALPSFAYPNQGSALVSDTGSAGATPAFGRSSSFGVLRFSALGLSFNASRQATDSYTLQPINDPRRLELMRCAYQRAVSSCGYGPQEQTCPDCVASFNAFYTGDPNGSIRDKGPKGGVTSECLSNQPCWFHVGPKKCVPKGCVPVGCYCNTYVWVLEEGRDQLTRLTLAILDYAINSPPARINKTVTFYVDEYGLPTKQTLAVGTVSASIGVDENGASLLNNPQNEELRLERIISSRLAKVEEEMHKIEEEKKKEPQPKGARGSFSLTLSVNEPKNGKGTQDGTTSKSDEYTQLLTERETLRNKLEYLNEQLSIPGLKREYEPLRPAAPTGGALLLNQSLQNLAPSASPPM
jgi:hypothetical protein